MRRIRRRAAGIRLHRQGVARRFAAGTGYFLSHQLSGPFQRDVRRAESWTFSHRARRPTLDLVRLVGRHHGPGLGHRSRAWRYAQLRRHAPKCAGFLHHCGDNIYADCPIAATRKLPDGTLWRSVVTEEKSKPAETLADYRGNYKYNLLDENLRAFNAAVPMIALWDNHEVMERWWPGEPLSGRPVDESNTLIFAARARRAFHEFLPVRESLTEPG